MMEKKEETLNLCSAKKRTLQAHTRNVDYKFGRERDRARARSRSDYARASER